MHANIAFQQTGIGSNSQTDSQSNLTLVISLKKTVLQNSHKAEQRMVATRRRAITYAIGDRVEVSVCSDF